MNAALNREQAAINSLMSTFFEYPQVDRINERLEWTRLYGRNPHGSYDAMMLIGEARTGKTRLLEAYRDRFDPYIDRDRQVIRRPQQVLVIEMPHPCTLKGVCYAIFDHFGLGVQDRPNTVKLVNDTMDLLRSIRVELLCLDEAHHMFRKDSKKHLSEVSDFIKTLLNQRVCCLVLSGMPELKALCRENDQLFQRVRYKLALKAYRWTDQNDQNEFRMILKLFEDELPFEPLGLGVDQELSYRLYHASGGRPGAAAALIKGAAIRVLSAGGNKLSRDAFECTYADLIGDDDSEEFNPFAPDADVSLILQQEATPTVEEVPAAEPAPEIDEAPAYSGLRKGKGRRPKVKGVFSN